MPNPFRLSVTVRRVIYFTLFVAELAQANGTAVAYRKLTAIHPVGYESLRMQCVGHIDAAPRRNAVATGKPDYCFDGKISRRVLGELPRMSRWLSCTGTLDNESRRLHLLCTASALWGQVST